MPNQNQGIISLGVLQDIDLLYLSTHGHFMINRDVYLFMWRMLQFNIFSKERLKKSPSFFGCYESRRKTIIGYILRFIVKASEQSGVRCIFCKPLQSSIPSNIYNYSSRRCHFHSKWLRNIWSSYYLVAICRVTKSRDSNLFD